jgi:hypothetical protein
MIKAQAKIACSKSSVSPLKLKMDPYSLWTLTLTISSTHLTKAFDALNFIAVLT